MVVKKKVPQYPTEGGITRQKSVPKSAVIWDQGNSSMSGGSSLHLWRVLEFRFGTINKRIYKAGNLTEHSLLPVLIGQELVNHGFTWITRQKGGMSPGAGRPYQLIQFNQGTQLICLFRVYIHSNLMTIYMSGSVLGGYTDLQWSPWNGIDAMGHQQPCFEP